MTNYHKFFERQTRNTGQSKDDEQSFYTLKDDAPEWLQNAVSDAHRGTLPNDWTYAECYAAVVAYDEGYIREGDTYDHVDSRVDVYTKNLFQWSTEFCLTETFTEAEEEAIDCDIGGRDIANKLQGIQHCAIRYITEVMVNACHENDANPNEGIDSHETES
jgi:hypothetical protein